MVKQGEIAQIGLYWADEEQVLEYWVWHGAVDVQANRPLDASVYIIGRHIVLFLGNKLGTVVEYSRDYPAKRLVMTMRDLLAIHLDIRSISINEIPWQVRDPEKLIEAMKSTPAKKLAVKFCTPRARPSPK